MATTDPPIMGFDLTRTNEQRLLARAGAKSLIIAASVQDSGPWDETGTELPVRYMVGNSGPFDFDVPREIAVGGGAVKLSSAELENVSHVLVGPAATAHADPCLVMIEVTRGE